MKCVVFIGKHTFSFYTVGKIYSVHKLDRHLVSIQDDDGDRVISDTYDLLFESNDEIHG